MSIPSSLLIHEIMHYQGFSAVPVQNRVGMPCIGYGFPLWEEALSILHGNARLAREIRANLPKDNETISQGVRRMLGLSYSLPRQKAVEFLVRSLLFYAEELGREYAGFRHIVNLCGDAVIFPQSSLACYQCHLERENSVHLEKVILQKGQTKEREKKSVVRTMPDKNLYGMFSVSEMPPHPAYLKTVHNSSASFGKSGQLRGRGTKKGRGANFYLPLTEEEQALLRVDSILFFCHLLGLEMTMQASGLFLALQEEDYDEASSQILAHGASGHLGAMANILARRVREGTLSLADISLQKEAPVKIRLHKSKVKNYMVGYFQKRKAIQSKS